MAGNMYQFRDRERALRSGPLELSARDREDAARLLTLLLDSTAPETLLTQHDSRRIAHAILEDRKRRAKIFNPALFGEPAWELLLNLYVVDGGQRLTVGRLTQLAGIAPTTALRWLDYLEGQGLIRREDHPNDSRTSLIDLTDNARDALRMYLSDTITPRL